MYPKNILLDTDMATDCDDVGALAVLHALVSAGEAKIAAIVVNNKDAASVGAVAAINAFYKRPEIPLGAYQGDVFGATAGAFVHALAADTAVYGHRIVSRTQTPSALEVYRRTLAEAADGSVTLVSIGHLNNLYDLLGSEGEDACRLPGIELIQKKIVSTVVMGGDYPSGKEHNFFARGSQAISTEVVNQWPTEILFTGYGLGLPLTTGPGLLRLPEQHPVRRAYALHPSKPLENGRPSWDQTAVLAAVRGHRCFWEQSSRGMNCVNPDGSNEWKDDPGGPHRYLIERESPAVVAMEIERLMLAQAEEPLPEGV